ncbi:UPF0175 family protein [Burkholderia glumae]|uniref:UPF0175 family protein n=1 Tax=Burkholderia glumae TaxID=337 RepID=UPI002151D78F|nr:UPF0175 family protein [Burkholderia glumae]
MTNNTTAPALTDEQRAAINMAISVLTPLAMDEYGDALRALLTSPRAAVPVVGYLCDSPAEPDIGYWFSEEPNTTHRCRALGFVDAAPDGWASSWIGINREAAQQTALDHGFKIWHRPESFGVAGTTRQAEELLACLLGVEVEIYAAPAAPVAEAEPAPDPLRRRVERLLVELHAEGRLSEGQCAKMLDISRVEWRALAEFLAPAAQAVAAPVAEPANVDLALIVAALEHSKPTHDHYPEARERHRKALESARSLVAGDQAVAADGAATDEPSEIEQVIACLGDDAAKLRDANPDDEMADNMEAAARMLFERAAIVEQSAKIADSFTCGSCGMDGKVGAAIRASQAAAPADAREPIYQCRLIKTAGWNDVSRTEFDACATNPARFETRTLFLLPADLGDAREPNQVYVECRQCDSCDHIGINDSHEADAACNSCGWNGPSPAEDKCPGCGDENCMAVACPKCSGRYALLAEGRFLADEIGVPADAGEAVAPSADLIARCRELLELSDHGESEQTALRALANTYRRDISPHDRRAMATSHTHLEAVKFVLDAAAQGAQGGKGGEA